MYRRLLLLLAVRSSCEFPEAEIGLLQWNPHWQCFVKSQACNSGARAALDTLLGGGDLDFANIVELPLNYTRPNGWDAVHSKCGLDITQLMYDSRKWLPEGDAVKGCLQAKPPDRPFVIQQFSSAAPTRSGFGTKVVVVGAHYPHPPPDVRQLATDLGKVMQDTMVSQVIFLADTNELRSRTAADIFSDIGVAADKLASTSLERTCCYNSDFPEQYTFDRIIANFGWFSSTEVLFGDMPSWARVGEFHKAVRATLHVGRKPTSWILVFGCISLGIISLVLCGGCVILAMRQWMSGKDAPAGTLQAVPPILPPTWSLQHLPLMLAQDAPPRASPRASPRRS